MKTFETFMAGVLNTATQEVMLQVLKEVGCRWPEETMTSVCNRDWHNNLSRLISLRVKPIQNFLRLDRLSGLYFSMATSQSRYGKFNFDLPLVGIIDLDQSTYRIQQIPLVVMNRLAGLMLEYNEYYQGNEGLVVDFLSLADGFDRIYEAGLLLRQHTVIAQLLHESIHMQIYDSRVSPVSGTTLRLEPIRNLLQLIRFFRFAGNVRRITMSELANYPDIEDAFNMCTAPDIQQNELFDLTVSRERVLEFIHQTYSSHEPGVLLRQFAQWFDDNESCKRVNHSYDALV